MRRPPPSRPARARGWPLKPLASLILAGCALPAQALSVTQVTPQGEVSRVSQVVVKFDAAAVNGGDARAPAPFNLRCEGGAGDLLAGSSARWNSPREWVVNLRGELPPGVSCTLAPHTGFKPLDGQAWAPRPYTFSTGGPIPIRVVPYAGAQVDEQQFFVLRFNGAVDPASLQRSAWCEAEGIGERIPVQLITGADRDATLKHRHLDNQAKADPAAWQVVSCNRRLPAGAKLKLNVGPGVRTPSGLAAQGGEGYTFQVQAPFEAEMSCQRENENAGCSPLSAVTLRFSAPLPWGQAKQIRLTGPGKDRSPTLEARESQADDALVSALRFAPPFAERSDWRLELPRDLRDGAGRALVNADRFPLALRTGPMPTLLKFSAAPFGIVERHAEGPGQTALLPLTVRKVEARLNGQALKVDDGQVRQKAVHSDADIIEWFRKVHRYDTWLVERKVAAGDVAGTLPPPPSDDYKGYVEARAVSLLQGQSAVNTVALPKTDGESSEMSVIGMPLPTGFHVVEVSSQKLGQALLSEAYGPQRAMVVRTSALVTNLGVHMKLGRENSLAWVTTLDKGLPVAGAKVQVSTCRGQPVAEAVTDAQGIARFEALSPRPPSRACGELGYFVSARAEQGGEADMSFTWTSWQNGIEPWRFNVDTSDSPTPDTVYHTVFDRTLLRAGETVSMKHFLRTQTGQGFGTVKNPVSSASVVNQSTGDKYPLSLTWRTTRTGGLSAESSWAIPKSAKLGLYTVQLGEDGMLQGGSFRVEEFRLPVLQGRITVGQPKDPLSLVAPDKLPVALQVSHLSGGPANGLDTAVSAMLSPYSASFPDYPSFSFNWPSPRNARVDEGDEEGDGETASATNRVIANKQAVKLDAQGAGQTQVSVPQDKAGPRSLLVEASYADPNGETQTLSRRAVLWPAAVVAGVRTPEWVSVKKDIAFDALALDLNGKPKAGAHVYVKAISHVTTSTRKRLVGGFYGYDSTTEVKDRGTVCAGKTDAQGLLACKAKFDDVGELELIAVVADDQGRESQAATSIWVTAQGELWFGGENHDRMDLLPEKRDYAVGDTAVFQVRMPFREAQALVTVEREGILHAEVVTLTGQDPTVRLKVDPSWGPNVYVSVMALRGRLYEVPWYSFFTWGYKTPLAWWRAFWNKTDEYVPPTAMVDLSKPAYRLGVTKIRVNDTAHTLSVKVQTDQPRYDVRGKAKVIVTATLPNGQPAAHAEVALAAVDQALLELQPNLSWKLREAMLTERPLGVSTSTAQMEIIGRRHYGRKALPPGGDGGPGSQTRELFDTLLLWQPTLQLDANGRAEIEVPLNDSLTTFTIAAVADSGLSLFGTGEARIRTTQDLQLISGVPPLVRSDDQLDAGITVRNTTDQPMAIQLTAKAPGVTLPARELELAAGQSQVVTWTVTVPSLPAAPGAAAQAWPWEIEAVDSRQGARDALRISPQVHSVVPVAVQQATLQQLSGPLSLPLQAPPTAARDGDGRPLGGVQVSVAAKLAEGLPGLTEWWRRYPYACLEQRTSKAIGLDDVALWQATMADLPTHSASNGLPTYFPAGPNATGSDALAAYLLAVAHEKGNLDPRFAIPAADLARLQAALVNFVEGRITASYWTPASDVGLAVRKLAAIEALSRYGKAQPRMLDSIALEPNRWPTSAVIDWLAILQRLPELPGRTELQASARQVLQARLQYQGTRLIFSNESGDNWFWTMRNADSNAANLLALALQDPVLQADVPRLATGLIGRAQRGHWSTTTANAWAKLALDRFSAQYEREPVSGHTEAKLPPDGQGSVDWGKVVPRQAGQAAAVPTPSGDVRNAVPALAPNELLLPWAKGGAAQTLQLNQNGSGKPWVTVAARAAVPLTAPFNGGYSVRKQVQVLDGGELKRGTTLRVKLDITANADMSWVAVSDPVPAGATILGSGLGRDSAMATQGEQSTGNGAVTFIERGFDSYRAYYAYLPKGNTSLEYTVRLNSAGQFGLPPTRVEALYAPEMFGETPNARLTVKP
ncbi:alpha-2-macroglobulin [Comamonas serinivorans]|uniref:Alpha-2-macroglobulin n=1 Tax=Comamonas serinivorans TaxID=1082851 RepID=A0A1Y0EMT0_9BURK|nr:MG2 domain-containing protein [Comamonas serinivorans]ARU04629.1 alpha-2-macroglobulin [Comamonas serinivorans]